ncbi:MAG: fatty acid desaturase, partial [Croceibacterium sp.]
MSEGPAGDYLLQARGGVQVEAFAPATDARAIPLTGPDGLDRYTRRDLRKQEIFIARQFMGGRMWPYVAAAWGCFAVWLSFFPLAIMGWLNLPAAFVVSAIFATGGYVTSHEAMHSNIGRPGTSQRFWNEAVGQVATLILIFPFSMARMMHLHHHYYTNDPDKDPDYTDGAVNAPMAWVKTWLNRQPGA